MATDPVIKTEYKYLEPRPDRRWKQYYLKDRGNLTARIVVGTMASNGLTSEETAKDYRLPVEAVHECMQYYLENKGLVDAEIRQMRIEGGLDPYEDKPLNPEE